VTAWYLPSTPVKLPVEPKRLPTRDQNGKPGANRVAPRAQRFVHRSRACGRVQLAKTNGAIRSRTRDLNQAVLGGDMLRLRATNCAIAPCYVWGFFVNSVRYCVTGTFRHPIDHRYLSPATLCLSSMESICPMVIPGVTEA
jgi:hypothetical protein